MLRLPLIFLLMSSMLLNSISYTPQYINKAYFGSRSCSGASGCTFTTLYQGIVGIPQKYIRALNGFETTGSDTLDLSFTQVFSSDRTTITFLNSVTQFNTIYFALILTNDEGVTVVNDYDLSGHPDWATFSTQIGYRYLSYNVSFIPQDPSLYQSDMSASLTFTRLNCSNSIDDLDIDLQVLEISPNWVTFSLTTSNNTVFEKIWIDIAVYSKSFRDAHGIIHQTTNLSNIDPWVSEAIWSTRAAEEFIQVNGYNYKTKPDFFYLIQGFKISKDYPQIKLEGRICGNSTIGMGMALRITTMNPVNRLILNVFTYCGNQLTCLDNPGYYGIDGEKFEQTANGLEIIGSMSSTGGSVITNYGLKKIFPGIPKYFAAGIYPRIYVSNPYNYFGSKLQEVTNLSYTISLEIGPDSVINEFLVFYILSDWGKTKDYFNILDGLQLHFIDFIQNFIFNSTFGTPTVLTTRELIVDLSYNPCPEISSGVVAKIIVTRWMCSNTTTDFGFNTTLLYYTPYSVTFLVTIYGDCILTVFEGYLMVYSNLSGKLFSYFLNNLVGYNIEGYEIDGTYNGHPPNTYNLYLNPRTKNKYPKDMVIIDFMTELSLRNTDFSVSTLYLDYSSNFFNNFVNLFITFGYSPNLVSAYYYTLFFINTYNLMIMDGIGPDILPNISQKAIILQGDYTANTFALIVTQTTQFDGNIFRFGDDNSSSPNMRIFQYSFFTADSFSSGSVNFGPINIFKSVNLTFWALRLVPTEYWLLLSYSRFLTDIGSPAPDYFFTDYFDYSRSSLKLMPKPITIRGVATFTSNATDSTSCFVSVNFNGILRALYFNDLFLVAGSSMNEGLSRTLNTSFKITFSPKQLFYVTASGHRLYINKISLTTCLNSSNRPVSLELIQYAIGSVYQTRNVSYNFATATPAPLCLISQTSSFCYSCLSGYVNNQRVCYLKCPTWGLYVSHTQYCENSIRSKFLRASSSPTIDLFNNFTDTFYVDADNGSKIITVFYPYNVTPSYVFVLSQAYTNPSLAESSSGIADLYSSIHLTRTLKPVQSSNKLSLIILWKGIPDKFTFSSHQLIGTLNYAVTYLQLGTHITSFPYANTKIEFLLSGGSGCKMSVTHNGFSIKILKDHRTVLMMDSPNSWTNYTLDYTFYGESFISIILKSSLYFNFSLSESCKIYGIGEFLGQDSLNINTTNFCNMPNCENCASNNECLSCQQNYFLDPIKKTCYYSCEKLYTSLDKERRCLCTGVCNYTLEVITTNINFCTGIVVQSSISPVWPFPIFYEWNLINISNSSLATFYPGFITDLYFHSFLDPGTYYPGESYQITLNITTELNYLLYAASSIITVPYPFDNLTGVQKEIMNYNEDYIVIVSYVAVCDLTEINITTSPNLQGISFQKNSTSVVGKIDRCTFNSSRNFSEFIYFQSLNYMKAVQIDFQTSDIHYIPMILNGDRKISYKIPINLQAVMPIVYPCPQDFVEPFQFKWYCINITTGSSCNFPLMTITNASNLNILGSSFNIGDQIKFQIEISLRSATKTTDTTIFIGDLNVLSLDFQCSQNLSTMCFVSNQQYPLFITASVNNQTLLDLDYYWSVPQLSGIVSFYFQNQIKLLTPRSLSLTSIRINLTVSNSTHSGYRSLNLPISLAPIIGQFYVLPMNGYALETSFYLEALDWYDIDMPLSYSFGYLVDGERRALVDKQNSTGLTTILPYWIDSSQKITLKAEVFDVFGSKSERFEQATLLLNSSSLTQNIESLFLNYNSSTDFYLLQELSVSLRSSAASILGHTQTIENKLRILNLIQNSSIRDEDKRDLFYDIVNDLTLNRTEVNTTLVSQIFNMVYELKAQGYATLEQATTASTIVNNLFEYMSAIDCSLSTDLGQQINNKSLEILQSIVNSLQNNMITNEIPTVITTNSFDIYTRKLTECELLNSMVSTSTEAPTLKFKHKDTNQQCQNQSMLFSYFAMSDHIFKCSPLTEVATKNDISMELRLAGSNVTSMVLLRQYYTEMFMPNGTECFYVCEKLNQDICICRDLDFFDMKGQIISLFKNSNFKYLENASAILTWRFYEDPVFYILCCICLCLVGSDFLIKRKYKNKCLVKEYRSDPERSYKEAWWIFFWVILKYIVIVRLIMSWLEFSFMRDPKYPGGKEN